jgi:hypothetical protein
MRVDGRAHVKKLFLAVFLAFLNLPLAGAEDAHDPWEKTIQAFEEQDRKTAPEPGGVLFLGSSSIRLWDTA